MRTETKANEIAWEDQGGGVKRRVLSHTPDVMLVQVAFEKGARGSVHSHPHAQCTYVLGGRFAFTAGDAVRHVAEGDTLAFPPGQPHGTLCEEAGALLDVFSPMREDFLPRA